jgi:voltage-gated potassium channel
VSTELVEADRRRLLVGVLARCTATTVVAFATYAVIPIGAVDSTAVIVRLLLSIVVFFGVIGWQARSIAMSPRPRLRAVEALASGLSSLIVIFAYVYVSLSSYDPSGFSEQLDRPAGVYFTTTVLATVGFGDIVPVSTTARLVVTVQMLLNLVVLGVVVRIVMAAVNKGVERQSSTRMGE